MANEQQDFYSFLSPAYMRIDEKGFNFLGKDAEGNDLFLVMVRAKRVDPSDGNDLPALPAPVAAAKNAPADAESALPLNQQLAELITSNTLMAAGCDKTHCAGPVNNWGRRKGIWARRAVIPGSEALAPVGADTTQKAGDIGLKDELDMITDVGRILHSLLQGTQPL